MHLRKSFSEYKMFVIGIYLFILFNFRCTKLGPDGDDDEEIDKKSAHAINVSYVDFDKTKPYSQKQSGDGLPHSASKYNSKPASQLQNNTAVTDYRNQAVNGKSGLSKTKNVASDFSVIENNKIKRQSRIFESEQKQPEASLSKLAKKHKRDIQ